MKKWTSLLIATTSLAILPLLFINCSGAGFSTAGGNSAAYSGPLQSAIIPAVSLSDVNVAAVTVGCGYVNEPCVSVTICIPGTTTCQTIPNVLVDTGSYGLRLFSQVSLDNFSTLTNLISIPVEADPANASNVLAECISYGDGSSDWGPIAKADVQLGNEKALTVPMQIINSTFGSASAAGCPDPDVSPMTTGFNGIIGVGLNAQDCGAACVSDSSNNIYFSCPANGSGTCAGAIAALALQTINPIALMPTDNNGVLLELPAVADAGATTASGYLVMGIGTRTNNTTSGMTTMTADSNANFITQFNGGYSSGSFIDSGSNGLYFPGPASLPECSGDSAGFYCPSSEVGFTAIQSGQNGASVTVHFNIANADNELSQNNPNVVFNNLGGEMSSDFDFGLPFFLGRAIAVGLTGTTSNLGTGPYWAF